jgi:hypothetical protein
MNSQLSCYFREITERMNHSTLFICASAKMRGVEPFEQYLSRCLLLSEDSWLPEKVLMYACDFQVNFLLYSCGMMTAVTAVKQNVFV